MPYLTNQFALADTQGLFDELDARLQEHFAWLDRVFHSLFCGDPPHPDDLAADAHELCRFGRWLIGQHHPLLERFGEFQELIEIHEQMHREARRLLLKVRQGYAVARDEYAVFSDSATALRQVVLRLEAVLQQGISATSRLTARVFENAAEAVVITDANAIIIDVNEAFVRITGYPRDEAIGRPANLLNSGRHGREFYAAMWGSLREHGSWQGEIWNRRHSGEIYPEWLSISAIHNELDGRVTHYVAMFSDISAAKRNEERLYRLAHYDALTGLANRGLFRESLVQALARAERHHHMVAVLFLDLDRFKVINDTLGHTAGDALLVDTAQRLQTCVRDSDLVGRQGGDEFTIILHDLTEPEDAAAVALKIGEAMSVPFQLEGRELFVTTSIGISLYPNHGADADLLTRSADLAMYHAKEQGRDNYQFYRPDGHEDLGEIFALEHGLRRALERAELRLHYQPQVDIESGAVVGMEALLRWAHPERGLLSPQEFIHIAEETGIINPIGRWVLEEACRQVKQWQDAGAGHFRIAVNLSARQLRQLDLPQQVAEALARSGLEPRWLQVELTETSVMHNPAVAGGLLQAIRDLGVTVAIDDFGSGYTSLSYLKRYAIDAVKIDRSFIEGLADNPSDQAISRAIIALAESLNMKVVAEGVETADQLDFLRANHCCDAQGFLFSHPLPPDQVPTALLRMGLKRRSD